MRVVDDPYVLFYIIDHLGKDVPPSAPLYKSLVGLQQITWRRLLIVPLPADLQDKVKKHVSTFLLDKSSDKSKERKILQDLAPHLFKASVKEIRAKLRDSNNTVRSLAIAVVERRRLPLEKELVSLLDDPTLQGTAHRALVRLARGTDFGPTRNMSHRTQVRCIAKWQKWLALQQAARKDAAIAKSRELDVIPAIAPRKERDPSIRPRRPEDEMPR